MVNQTNFLQSVHSLLAEIKEEQSTITKRIAKMDVALTQHREEIDSRLAEYKGVR